MNLSIGKFQDFCEVSINLMNLPVARRNPFIKLSWTIPTSFWMLFVPAIFFPFFCFVYDYSNLSSASVWTETKQHNGPHERLGSFNGPSLRASRVTIEQTSGRWPAVQLAIVFHSAAWFWFLEYPRCQSGFTGRWERNKFSFRILVLRQLALRSEGSGQYMWHMNLFLRTDSQPALHHMFR